MVTPNQFMIAREAYKFGQSIGDGKPGLPRNKASEKREILNKKTADDIALASKCLEVFKGQTNQKEQLTYAKKILKAMLANDINNMSPISLELWFAVSAQIQQSNLKEFITALPEGGWFNPKPDLVNQLHAIETLFTQLAPRYARKY